MSLNEYGLLDISEIRQRIDALAAKIDAPENFVPSAGSVLDDEHPYYEVSWAYHLVKRERADECRRWTADFNEFLYWVFERVTSNMAMGSRTEQLSLLERLDPAWRARQEAETASE